MTTTVMETIIAAMADCFSLVGEVVTQITERGEGRTF